MTKVLQQMHLTCIKVQKRNKFYFQSVLRGFGCRWTAMTLRATCVCHGHFKAAALYGQGPLCQPFSPFTLLFCHIKKRVLKEY